MWVACIGIVIMEAASGMRVYNIIAYFKMIKGIFEKIILSTFGQFIKGIQKDKLSVDLFGGNFKL